MSHRYFFRILTVRGPFEDHVADSDLLRRFTQEHDPAALELVIRRHASAVWTACRRILACEADAEDAFQATFLVLVKKAGAIRESCIGGWLHQVAVNTALKQRERAARMEVAAAQELSAIPAQSTHESNGEHAAIIQEELARLPDRYRLPVVLCEVEGLTHAEAAKALGWPIGSVSGRLSRARNLLRDRLSRRGLAPTAIVLTSLGLPSAIVGKATAAATGTKPIPPIASSLSEGVLSMMRLTRMKSLVIRLASAGVIVLVGLGTYIALGQVRAYDGSGHFARSAEPPAKDKSSASDKKVTQKEDAPAMELKALQGEWKVVGLESNGKKASAEDVKGMRWIITGNLIEGQDPEEKQKGEVGKFTIDPGKDPKQINITGSKDGPGKVALGIYKLENGRLTICLRSGRKNLDEKDRPKDFNADFGENDQGLIILESLTAPPKPDAHREPAPAEANAMRDKRWVVKDKETLELVGAAGTAETFVKVPRWKLTPGQEIIFSGGMQTGNEEKGYKLLARGDWSIYVLGENKDGSLSLVIRSSLIIQGSRRIDSARLEMFPDGRTVAGKNSEARMAMGDQLPHLPPDAAEAAVGWKASSAGDKSTLRYRLAAPTKTGQCCFEEVTELAGVETVGVDSYKRLFTWDAERGLPDSIRSETVYSDKRGDRAVFKFKEVKTHDQSWRDDMSADSDRCLAAQAAYLRGFTKLNLNLTHVEIEDSLKKVQADLTSVRQSLKRSDFQEQLDELLASHEHQTKSILELAERRRSVLGHPAAEWSTTDLDGKKHSLKDYRGKVVVLDFWYSTCYHCVRGMPQMKEIASRFKDQAVVVLGVNTDAKDEDAGRVVDKMGLNYPTLKAGDIPKDYKVEIFPTLIVIDQEGVVREIHIGYSETLKEDISKEVEGLLKPKT